MTNSKDCPLKSNDKVRAGFLDTGMADDLAGAANLTDLLALVAKGKISMALNEAHNATRLHTHNIAVLREACDDVDKYRATEEGKAVYNAKRRAEYVPAGEVKREYVTGLSDEEKKERRRLQKRSSDKKRRDQTPAPVKSAKRVGSRKRTAERAKAEAEKSLAARKIF